VKEKKDCERHEKARKRGKGDGEGEGEEDKLIQRPKLHTRLRPLLSASLSLCCLPLGSPSYSPQICHFQFNGRRKTYTRIEEFKRRERELKLEKKWRINDVTARWSSTRHKPARNPAACHWNNPATPLFKLGGVGLPTSPTSTLFFSLTHVVYPLLSHYFINPSYTYPLL
jgi:hypothetical protein